MSIILIKNQGEFYYRPRGNVLIESTQIGWFLEKSGRRLDLESDSQRHSKLSEL